MARKNGKNMPSPKIMKTKSGAVAIQATSDDGSKELVGIGNVRVIIVPDGKSFFAQGLEIDYAAQGPTVDRAKENFEKGFRATIQQHLELYGNLKHFLVPAPTPIWQEMLPEVTQHNRYFHVSIHKIEVASLPYDGIRYLVAATAA